MKRSAKRRLDFIRRAAWLIVVQALLTAGATYGFSAIQVPVYEATAEVIISARSMQIIPVDLVVIREDYAAYLHSTFRAQEVVDELRLDLPATTLLENATMRAGTETSTVEIVVENSDPELAREIARVWAEQLVALRRLENAELPVEQQVDADLLDRIQVRLVGPRPWLNAAAGLVLGAALGVVLLLWLEWLAGAVVRDEADAEAVLEAPVVGRIPGEGG